MFALMRMMTVLLFVSGAVFFGATSSVAEEPVNISGPVTDSAGVLGGDRGTVDSALQSFFDDTGLQLFVVYVPDFSGMGGQEWATATAEKSNLGTADILLAIATQERSYGYSVDDNQAISDADLQKVERDDILPQLRDNDWAGAAVAAAEGYTKAANDSGLPWGGILIGGAAVAGVGAFAVSRMRRKYDTTHVVLDEHGQPVDPLSLLSTDELDSKASIALVGLDDAIKTSEQELGFAEAQFGPAETAEFKQLVADGHEALKKGFGIRQLLDDGEPESEPQKRQMATEIITLCQDVDASLDAQVEEFDRLRDLQAKAPEVLDSVMASADALATRIPATRETLAQLQSKHPATSLASVTGNPDQAEALLASAREQASKGQQSVANDDRATAVIHARAGEDAIGQVTTLLDAVANAEAHLAEAPGLIANRIQSLSTDVADVERLGAAAAGAATAADTARQALAYAQQASNDPLAALKGLEDAEAALDDLLAAPRAAAAEAEKARTALKESLGRVSSKVKAVSDFIETRRGAVQAEARTRLSEAARHLERASQTIETEPTESLAALQKAESFADEAQQLAQRDVQEWERSQRPKSGGSGGGSLNSMILGGILVDALSGGGGSRSGRSSGGSILGGSGGGGGGGGGRSPGSFGGSSTRGRRGGGGRF